MPVCTRIDELEPEYTSSFKRTAFPDFVIESCDGKEFPCHRVFLAARSTVFKVMFDSDMKEAKENRMKMDFSAFIIDNFLSFIYGHKIDPEILLTNNKFFLDLAEAYNIEMLKLKTEKILIENMEKENMIELFVLSEHYNCSYLGEEAKKFMVLNKDALKTKDLNSQLRTVDQEKIVCLMQMLL